MVELVLNHEHFTAAVGEAMSRCRHRLLISTAHVKLLQLPGLGAGGRERAPSILEMFAQLARGNVEIRLLHGSVPSEPFLLALKRMPAYPMEMRRCPRVHAKAVIADNRWMYLGSANLTGAGLGAKSKRRRNFEAGIRTDETRLIDPVADMIEDIWTGRECPNCGRKKYCPVRLEEPDL